MFVFAQPPCFPHPGAREYLLICTHTYNVSVDILDTPYINENVTVSGRSGGEQEGEGDLQ